MANIVKKPRSAKHNHNQLSFNQNLLLSLSDKPNLLLLYLSLRKYARHRYGSFTGYMMNLSKHERYVLLPQLEDMGLVAKENITNHRNTTKEKYGNKFIKIPNFINSKQKLKAFIVSVAETIILKKRKYSYRYKYNAERDQEKGYTIKTVRSSRNRQSYTSYIGYVTRNKIKTLTGYTEETISRLRKLSLNRYGELLTEQCFYEDNASYIPHYNSFIHYLPRKVFSKIHCFSV